MIPPVRCTQAAAKKNDTDAVKECLEKLVPKAAATVPTISGYPELEHVLVSSGTKVLELISGLTLGTSTVKDVNEATKTTATDLKAALPKVK